MVNCHFQASCSVPPGKDFPVPIAQGSRTDPRPGLDGEAKTEVCAPAGNPESAVQLVAGHYGNRAFVCAVAKV